jgi:hypothetical protein
MGEGQRAAGATVREPGGVVPPGCYAIRVLKEKEIKQFGALGVSL